MTISDRRGKPAFGDICAQYLFLHNLFARRVTEQLSKKRVSPQFLFSRVRFLSLARISRKPPPPSFFKRGVKKYTIFANLTFFPSSLFLASLSLKKPAARVAKESWRERRRKFLPQFHYFSATFLFLSSLLGFLLYSPNAALRWPEAGRLRS